VLLRQRHAFSFFFFSFFSFLARFSRLRASRASSSASRRRRFWSRRRSSAKGSESELSLSLPLLEAEDICRRASSADRAGALGKEFLRAPGTGKCREAAATKGESKGAAGGGAVAGRGRGERRDRGRIVLRANGW